MARARILAISVFVLVAAVCFPSPSRAQANQSNETNWPEAVSLTPAVAVAGSPELIRIAAPGAQEVTGEWFGRKLSFFKGSKGGNWYALAGLDVEAPVGDSTLKVEVKSGEAIRHFDVPIDVHPAQYRTEAISVAPKFVEPNPEELKQVEADSELKAKVFATSAPEPLWNGDFRAPVISPSTDSFGVRRMYNGKLASIHKGMDFRAHMGTPVRAGNSGVVVLARRLYFEGNCVVVDHGLGLYTLSMHLSRIDVHEGQQVSAGQRLGLSGATGRVTGPHLHWAVRWEGAYLDPAKLLHLNLDAIH
jgi:murein DD-endopeptidase MepM/ murein hydrolase activator NlpD